MTIMTPVSGSPVPSSSDSAPAPLSASAAVPTAPPAQAARRAWGSLIVRGTLILALLLLVYKAARIGLYGRDAYGALRATVALRDDGDLDTADLVQAQGHLAMIRRAVSGVDRELSLFYPLLRAAVYAPWIGPTIAALPDFMAAGRSSLDLAQTSLGLLVAAGDPTRDTPLPELLIHAVSQNPAPLAAELAELEAILQRIQPSQLLSPLTTPVAQAQTGLTLANAGMEFAPFLPQLLGFTRPQVYLLLVQNNQELRPTGGFISAVGTVTVDKGKISGLNFVDSYDIARNDVDHPWAPLPMQRYMQIELIFLRDANWSPDFPTTAQLARSLYAQDAGVQVDGVVSVDLHAVELFIGALEPLIVEGVDEPITRDNLIPQIQQMWDRPPTTDATLDTDFTAWLEQRKSFIPLMTKAALDRVESGRANPLALAEAAASALAIRSVQVWMADANTAKLLQNKGWDGRLRPQPGADYLALVDTNMGYNKVDAVLSRRIHYQLVWPEGADARGEATVAVTYRHPVRVENVVCSSKSEYGEVYTDMIERCYFDYVRLYVPLGSELISIQGVTEDSVTSQPGERGTQVLAGYFVLEPGRQHTVTFRYRLPATITRDDYQLVVQRQSGTRPLPLEISAHGITHTTTLSEGIMGWTPTPAQP